MLRSAGDCVLETIDFRVLGPVEALRGGARLDLGGAKRRGLLALLLLHPNEVVAAERLILDLWGERAPSTAANTLQVNVSQLRKALGVERIVRKSGGYVLRVEPGELDLHRFEGHTASGRASLAAEDFAAAASELEQALSLWRGPALAELAVEEWAAVEAGRLEELRLVAVESRLDALLGLGSGPELVAELESLVAEHPLRERLCGQLMLSLYRAGRQADALEVYRNARARLVAELGLELSPPLRRLEQAILAQDPELDGSRPSARASLPAPANALIGRADELREIERLLADGRRLLTFTGPGGIGKSRLALEVARRSGPSFRDGAVFVSLAAVSEPELVAASILQGQGLAAGADPEQMLLDALGSREQLLVLDNFEQVVDFAPARCTAARRLAGPCRTRDEPVRSCAWQESTSIRCRRSCCRTPSISSSTAHGRSRRTCPPTRTTRRSERSALASKACRSRSSSRPLVCGCCLHGRCWRGSRAGSTFSIGARRDAPERQRTMRGAIEWSYRLLEPDEQLLFARLGVFVDGASLDAVEAVCGDVATLDVLASLVDKSLIRQRGSEEPRYAMLETLREYALEQLAGMGEQEEIQRRHIQCFAGLVGQAEAAIAGREQRLWLDRLETDHANLRLAIETARERGDSADAVAIAGGLRTFWYVHGHAKEGLSVLDTVLVDADGTPALARSKAHNGAAMLASDLGDYAAVRRHLLRSLELAEELGDPLRVGIAQMNLGNVALYEQNWDEAERLYQEALRIYREVGDLREQAIVLEDLGLVALGRGDVEGAIATLEEAIEHARAAEAPHEIGSARLELARVLISRGESERPRRLAADAYDIFSALDARSRIADSLETFAGIAATTAAYDDAARLFGAAEAIRTSIGTVRQADQDRWVDAVLTAIRDGLQDDTFEHERAVGRELDTGAVEALCTRYRG